MRHVVHNMKLRITATTENVNMDGLYDEIPEGSIEAANRRIMHIIKPEDI